MLKLHRISEIDLNLIEEYKDSFTSKGLPINGGFFLEQFDDLNEWLSYEEKVEKGETDWTPTTTFFYGDNTKIVGIISVRHNIEVEPLNKYYGHIGYSVHPDFRRQGHAKTMLSSVLPFCKEIGIDKLLITCVEDNIGSYKTIEANGGILESIIEVPNSKSHRRYWINL